MKFSYGLVSVAQSLLHHALWTLKAREGGETEVNGESVEKQAKQEDNLDWE